MNHAAMAGVLGLAFLWPAASTAETAPSADITETDASWNTLRLRSDTQAMSALLLDDWVLTHSDGRVEDRSSYLSDLRRGTRINTSIVNEDVEIRRHDGVAVVTGTTTQSGIGADGPFSGRFRFTRVWVLRDGVWRMLASHSSRLALPTPAP